MGRLIIFDFEVFKYDTLLGCVVLDQDNQTLIQTWDLKEIKQFYEDNKDDAIWIGHNNSGYDNFILQSIVEGKDPKKTNDDIIVKNNRYQKLKIKLYFYDLMLVKQTSLKAIEAFEGKNISESGVPFDIDRPLTEQERLDTESYNRDDLDQTLADFNYLRDGFELRLMLLNEFGIPLTELSSSEASLAAKILGSKTIAGIERQIVRPTLYPNLRLKNQQVIDFYLGGSWAQDQTLSVTLCGTENKLARGGIHGAIKNSWFDSALYIDVSGYYNLIMILFGLLPRTIPQEGKDKYKYLFQEQLKMKKTNPKMRAVFKVILLAVSGSMMNENTEFYDPYHGDLMRLTGQIFIVDLLEKLEGKVLLIQSNTDGIILKPQPGVTEQQILDVVNEWMDRTGFHAKIEHIFNITQRDVNNYIYQTDSGKIEVRGEAVKHYDGYNGPFDNDGFSSKKALIIAQAMVEYFVNGIDPAETINKFKDNLKLFQYICKKGKFDYMEYEQTDLSTGNITQTTIQKVNRAFALKSDKTKGMVYKRNYDGKKNKYPGLPPSVFVYDNEILSPKAIEIVQSQIDYDYYIEQSYKEILKFMGEEDESQHKKNDRKAV